MVDFGSPEIKVALTKKKPQNQVHGEAKLRGKGPSSQFFLLELGWLSKCTAQSDLFFSVTAFTVCCTNIIEYCP